MQVKQKKDQYRPKVRASRNYCLQPASHAILEPGRLKRPEPERGIETIVHTTVALLSAEEEVSPPGRLNKQAATSGELAEPLPPVLTPLWSTPGWVPDVGCSCGCGSVDVRARPLWGRATHDEP